MCFGAVSRGGRLIDAKNRWGGTFCAAFFLILCRWLISVISTDREKPADSRGKLYLRI